MPPRLTRLLGMALLLALCLSAVNQGAARLVRDKAAPSNPAVDSNGVRLKSNPEPAIQYSLVGAIVPEGPWFTQCALRPFELIGRIRPHHRLPRFFEDSRFRSKPHTTITRTPFPFP